MGLNIQDFYEDLERLKKNRNFDAAAEKCQEGFDSFGEHGDHGFAIDCIIQKNLCRIEPYLQDVTIGTESEARKTLRPYLDKMETELQQFTGDLTQRIQYNSLHQAYLQLEKLYDKYGFIAEASEMFGRSMDYRRKFAWETSKLRWVFLWTLKVTCRYGESGRLLLIWGFGLILSFGTIYWGFQLIDFSNGNAGPPGFWDSLYFSVVVLTTLGFGDISPNCLAGRVIVGIQVILGYTLLGIFISILASKIIRR
ncbi:two pore domain potassium channel family protein [Candidatus Poribacteria bacterium]|nr:two pore domain potassium channel family protein [Candidatus Poribacteria bacterium]